MHKPRRIERLPRFFASHLRGRELAQFVVDEREQIRGGVTVAAVGGFEELGDVGHSAHQSAAKRIHFTSF